MKYYVCESPLCGRQRVAGTTYCELHAVTAAPMHFERPKTTTDADVVNHPTHYTSGSIEVIDAIEAWDLSYHLGNAVKYIARAGKKTPDPTTDIQKAMWYLERFLKERAK